MIEAQWFRCRLGSSHQREALPEGRDGGVDVLTGRCGNNYFLGAAGQVGRGFFAAGEETGAFQDNVYTQLAPRQFCGVLDGRDTNLFSVDNQAIGSVRHCALKTTMGRVVLQQVGQGRSVGEVVDSYNLNVGTYDEVAKGEAADAAKSVDCDLIHSEYKKTSKMG